MNRHLDKLKEFVIKELDKICDDYHCRIASIISTLKDQEHDIKHCKSEFESITKYASEIQTFLGMREIQSKVANNESRLKSMITNESLENVDLQFTTDEKISDVLTAIKAFGSITIKKRPFALTNISSKKNKQAQISAPNKMQPINTLSVKINRKFNTICKWTRGCSMTQKGLFIFIDSYSSNEKLVAINGQGKIEYTIQPSTFSRIYGALDVELINDNTVAVTTGDSFVPGQRKGVSVVDLTRRKVIKFIDLSGYSYGITHNGTSLICCVQDQGIHVISCTDDSITIIPNTVSARYSYVTTHADTILFTNPDKHEIVCCSYDGTPVWEFNNDILRTPRGITVDDKGNIFVVGQVSCNVLILSPIQTNTEQGKWSQ